MLEWGLFSTAALLVGWIGTAALAAHQIALQVASVQRSTWYCVLERVNLRRSERVMARI